MLIGEHKIKVKEDRGARKNKDEVLSFLEPILMCDMDSLSDLEGFLQKTVQAAATVVSSRSSRLILYKQQEKTVSPSPDFYGQEIAKCDNFIKIPLILRGLEHPMGYIEVRDRKDSLPFDLRDLVSIIMIGRQATLKLENDLFYHRIYENMLEMLKALVNIIESRDPYIHCHSSRVSNFALRIAKDIDIPEKDIDAIRIASLLHDIGKIGIPDHILSKKSHLTSEEEDIIRTHSVIGENIIKPLAFLFQEKEIIRHHHEYFDGSGYPDGLKGEDIPIGDRIIAVADAFDAMTSNRPYRLAKSAKESFKEIESLKNIKYDPHVVKSFKKCLKKNNPGILAF